MKGGEEKVAVGGRNSREVIVGEALSVGKGDLLHEARYTARV